MSENSPGAGTTAISDLGRGTDELTYRGYALEDLAARSTFEEVAHLLLRGRLPTQGELIAYRARLRSLRSMPTELAEVLARVPDTGGLLGTMRAMRTACSFLGSSEPEGDGRSWLDVADRLLAILPGVMVGWYRRGLQRVDDTGESTTAGHILALLEGQGPSQARRRVLDASLVCYADLAFNASTYVARICASTGSELHACVTAAISALEGPKHGGASGQVMELLDRFRTASEASAGVLAMLDRKERVPGFGHAIFKKDPRSEILHARARELAEDSELLAIAEEIEGVVADRKGLRPNVDFYTAVSYRQLGLPVELFSPLFVSARVAGWAAHVNEQRMTGKLIHPEARYEGPSRRDYVAIEDRGEA